MNAVAARATAENDDEVARPRLLRMAAVRQHAQAATEDERVVDIAFIIKYRAVDGGNAHLVAIVAHAADDAAGDTPGRKHADRQALSRSLRRAKAENIGAGNGLRGDAQHVAN